MLDIYNKYLESENKLLGINAPEKTQQDVNINVIDRF
jgi:hypothetical protein